MLKGEAERDLDDSVELLKALSDPLRLHVLAMLRRREVCVCVLVRLLSTRHSTLSYHLKLLKRAGLVQSKREQGFQVYALTPEGQFTTELVMRLL